MSEVKETAKISPKNGENVQDPLNYSKVKEIKEKPLPKGSCIDLIIVLSILCIGLILGLLPCKDGYRKVHVGDTFLRLLVLNFSVFF